MSSSRDEIQQAREEADRQSARVRDTAPALHAEAAAVLWRLTENNLAARIRAALKGEK